MRSRLIVISDTPALGDLLVSKLSRGGLAVLKASTAGDLSATDLRDALCIVVDMVGDKGLETLEALREKGITAPALLVVDKADMMESRAAKASVLEVLERPARIRVILGWIECVCAAHLALKHFQARRAA